MTAPTVQLLIVGTNLPNATCGPYEDVQVGVQVGREYRDLFPGDAPRAQWALEVRAAAPAEGGYGLRGPAIHGKPGERFLYLAWLSRGSMFRRAKLQLDAVPPALVQQALRDGALIAELELTDACGMPRCASVRPPLVSWTTGPSARGTAAASSEARGSPPRPRPRSSRSTRGRRRS